MAYKKSDVYTDKPTIDEIKREELSKDLIKFLIDRHNTLVSGAIFEISRKYDFADTGDWYVNKFELEVLLDTGIHMGKYKYSLVYKNRIAHIQQISSYLSIKFKI